MQNFKQKYLIVLILLTSAAVSAQNVEIKASEALRVESVLASDAMRGRKPGTPEIDMAADFIASEFKRSGLKNLPGISDYKQTFSNIRSRFISAEGTADNVVLESKNIIAITTDSLLKINESSGYNVVNIGASDNLQTRAAEIYSEKKNSIVFVNTVFEKDFARLKRIKSDGNKIGFNIIFVLLNSVPEKYQLEIKNRITELKLTNVVGMIPGKSKKDEYVVFSSHYDHLGVSRVPDAKGDSVFNGANDDAAGTTGVILLAERFSKLKNNERSIIFVAFTAEEIGGMGSQYFSKNIDPDKVVVMFNLEMIGTESKWGKNSAYITGFEKSDLGKILQKNAEGTGFRFESDPYPTQNLFYRSDNATLAALGVPAHTISTSKMDIEPNYHKLSDEVSSLDMDNMAAVITAIAQSSRSIVSGKETPSRVEKKN